MIDKISSKFGSQDVDVKAYVYTDADVMAKLTAGHKVKRNTKPEAKEEGEE